MRPIKFTLKPSPAPSASVSPARAPRVKLYTFAGKTMNLVQWAQETGIHIKTLRDRINQLGWSIERALTEPVVHPNDKKHIERNKRLIRRMADAFQPTAEK